MPDYYWPLWRPVIGRDTFSALAPVLGPWRKDWLCYPLPLFTAVSTIPNMWHSSCYCMRRSWQTKFGGLSLNQLVAVGIYAAGVCEVHSSSMGDEDLDRVCLVDVNGTPSLRLSVLGSFALKSPPCVQLPRWQLRHAAVWAVSRCWHECDFVCHRCWRLFFFPLQAI